MIATKCLFQLIACFAFVAHHVRSDDCCDYADVCLYGDYLGDDYEPYTDGVDGWTEGVTCGAQALAAFGSDGVVLDLSDSCDGYGAYQLSQLSNVADACCTSGLDKCDFSMLCKNDDWLGDDYEPYTDSVDGWEDGITCSAQMYASGGETGAVWDVDPSCDTAAGVAYGSYVLGQMEFIADACCTSGAYTCESTSAPSSAPSSAPTPAAVPISAATRSSGAPVALIVVLLAAGMSMLNSQGAH